MKKSIAGLLGIVACSSLLSASMVKPVQFELEKDTGEFTEVEVKHKFDLTFNYQILDQSMSSSTRIIDDLQAGMILPTADLDFEAKVMKGFNTKLEFMLSSHHHHEAYMKGGWATIDSLDFVSPGFAEGLMDQLTIKVGVDDINFGDYHFRRTDNADVFRNPFVLNTGVEAYMQAGFFEFFYRIPSVNMFAMYGITNGQANPNDVKAGDGKGAEAHYFKVGYDNKGKDTRFRITESYYTVSNTSKNSMFNGDKAGNVAIGAYDDNVSSGDFGFLWNPMGHYSRGTVVDFSISSTNVFFKTGGTEIFGLVELLSSEQSSGTKKLDMTHYSIEALQRFGDQDRFYVAARYENAVSSDEDSATDDSTLTQAQAAFGWFLSPNALAKVEYVKQERENFSNYTSASIDGLMISTALSF